MIVSDEQFALLKQKELQIMIEIDRVCRKHDIKYSLAFGTLIGAIRHKGFIPWDDDIDVFMTRDNYDKFKEVIKTDLDDKMFFIDRSNNKHFGLLFGKMMLKNTLMSEVTTPKRVPSGIFVDIFVVEKTSLDEKEQRNQFNKYWTLRRIFLRRCFYMFKESFVAKLMYRVSGCLCHLLPSKLLDKKDAKNKLKFKNLQKFKWILCEVDDKKFENAIYDRSVFENYIDAEFEGKKFMVIKDYDFLLRSIYGDYMELPPVESRSPQHVVRALDLGE